MKSVQSKPEHLFVLDTLRGIAALSVCLFHFSGKVLPKLNVPEVQGLFGWGWLGVEIFFVISGFIIPYVLLKSKYTLKNFGNFIGKRFVRICPPSWIVILFTIVQYFIIDHFFHSEHSWMATLSVPQVLHSLAYTIPFTNYEWVNSIFWTLAVEFQFYLLLGLIFTFMYKNATNFVICAVALCSLYYLPFSAQLQFFKYSTLFSMGGAVVLKYERRMNQPVFFLVVAGLAIIGYFQIGLETVLFGLSTALIIAFVKTKNKLGSFLGKISYSLYLTHIVVGSSLETVGTKLLKPDTVLNRVIILGFCLAGTVAFAYIFWKFVEVYFINLANKLFAKKTGSAVYTEKKAVAL
jgi:peptidoglycan/LPS O-acetylase OafA/YrhL